MTQAEVLFELNDVEELEEMPSLEHGAIGIRLGRYLDAYVDEKGLGLVCNSQTTYKFIGQNQTVYPIYPSSDGNACPNALIRMLILLLT